MISLTFSKPHRSIRALPEVTLPDFAVITGVNGSGKSHLLEAINNGSVVTPGVSIPPQPVPPGRNQSVPGTDVRLFTWNNLVPAPGSAADPIQLDRERNAFITHLTAQFAQLRKNFINQVAQW